MSGGSLAVLGATPRFREPLHVNRPYVGDEADFLARVKTMLDRRWFTNDGPNVEGLERRIAERVGVRHCVLVSNGTTALQLAIRALGLSGEVLVPSFTFVATAHALAWEGIKPVFCDIDPDTWNLDPEACEAAITPATRGILGVHLFGRPCEVDRLDSLARRHGLEVLLDAAHAFGCSLGDRPIGNFGAAEIFSFHATKVFHTFEGGAVATNRDEVAACVRLSRNFGFRGFDDVGALGINAKMPEICAAMGLSNLACFEELVEANRATFEAYRTGLEGIPGVRLRLPDPGGSQNWQYIVLEVDAEELGLSRDELVSALNAENVLARRYFFPGCHQLEPYRSRDPSAGERLPGTLAAAARVVVLPTGDGVSPDHAVAISRIVHLIAERADEVRAAIRGRVAVFPGTPVA